MRTVHLDCPSGIAGDMLLAALIDLGASAEYVREGLASLGLTERWSLDFVRVQKLGISALQAEVRVDGVPADLAVASLPYPGDHAGAHRVPHHHSGHRHHTQEHHDHEHHKHEHLEHEHHEHEHHEHEHEYAHHGRQRVGHEHAHQQHGHGHSHVHDHGRDDAQHHHPHRPYREIRSLIEASSLPERVRSRAGAVFWELAKAEGAVHGIDPDEVHFHEVGSTDAIIDIVGCALALESLGIDELTASELHVGKGFVRTAHGRLPVPAPATLKLLEGFPIYQTDITGELVTPTGAALVRALCKKVGPMSPRRIQRVGCGAGRRDLPIPNVVRAILSDAGAGSRCESGINSPGGASGVSSAGSASHDAATWLQDDVVEIEANIDDMPAEIYSYLFNRLLGLGALDVWVVPVTMKKSRPAHVLHVLAPPANEVRLVQAVFEETTTLGVRVRPARRWMLERSWIQVEVDGEPVRVKLGTHQGRILNASPEYDDCARAAARLNLPLKLVSKRAEEQALRESGSTAEGSGRREVPSP